MDNVDPAKTKYLYKDQCLAACPDGYTYNPGENMCAACNSGIKKCEIGNPEAPIECYSPYFLNVITTTDVATGAIVYTNECVIACPARYYGDQISRTCEKCHEMCSTCSGSAANCQACVFSPKGSQKYFWVEGANSCVEECPVGYQGSVDATSGYALCKPIKCETEYCVPNGCHNEPNFCDECLKRVYDIRDDTVKRVQRDETSGVCVTCDSKPGLKRASDQNCYNICGDGYLYNLGPYDDSDCDDGNLTDGDGCSSNCSIEDNYTCKRGGLNTNVGELYERSNADKCDKTLVWKLEEDPSVKEVPTMYLKFDFDVCFKAQYFLDIYKPYCVKKGSNGKRVDVTHFEVYIQKPCREYRVEYKLQDDYNGLFGFFRKDDPPDDDPLMRALSENSTPKNDTFSRALQVSKKNRREIYDQYNNIVDFTTIQSQMAYSNAAVLAREQLARTALEMEKLQAALAGPVFIAMMAIGPLADFNANVLQRLAFLELLEIDYPPIVQMYLTLFSGLGSSGSAVSADDPDYTGKTNEQKGMDLL